jgi:hypothetical protein
MSDDWRHFLDTSVARPVLLGSHGYRQYFKAHFRYAPCYISPYILMEMNRSYLRNLIEFYFTLKSPQMLTLGDALAYWSNRFQGSKHKAIQQMIAQLVDRGAGNPEIFRDKRAVLIAVELLIQSFVESLHNRFINTERDATSCARAKLVLNFEVEDVAAELAQFAVAFDDVELCRSQCQIDQFLLTNHRDAVIAYTLQKDSLPKTTQSRGFLKLASTLKDILDRGADACSCKRCEQIGDAVIALDAPRNMRLEHTDHSFDYLCPPIQQPHQKHPPEIQVMGADL